MIYFKNKFWSKKVSDFFSIVALDCTHGLHQVLTQIQTFSNLNFILLGNEWALFMKRYIDLVVYLLYCSYCYWQRKYFVKIPSSAVGGKGKQMSQGRTCHSYSRLIVFKEGQGSLKQSCFSPRSKLLPLILQQNLTLLYPLKRHQRR